MTLLHLEEPRALEKAIAILQRGGVIAFPTDTVYGVGASLSHPEALDRIYESKARDRALTLPVLIGSVDDLDLVSRDVDPDLLRLASHFWPGPLTVAVPAIPGKLPPHVVAPDGTVGVRVPNHSVALVLAQRCGGAMAVTSANLSGQPSATHPEDIDPDLSSRLDLVLDGGIARGGLASTVIGLRDATITVIREGAIPAGDIEAIWSRVRSASNGGSDEGHVPAATMEAGRGVKRAK